MSEARRLAYLDAMGIRVWRLRDADADGASEPAAAAVPRAERGGEMAGGEPPESEAEPPVVPRARADAPATAAGQHASAAAAPGAVEPSAPAVAAGIAASRSAMEQAPPAPTQTAGEEPPPWTDADFFGTPSDDAHTTPDLFAPEADPHAAPRPANPVADMDWDALAGAVKDCRACGLCRGRTNTVFGVGDRNAQLMFVGEAPGADEDRQGEPFVGRAGQLLNRMLAAVGLEREQVYIANIVKCRPPGNRDPLPEEAAACAAYLRRQIELVQPKLLVSLGRVSATNLLASTESVGRLRGREHPFGPEQIPLIVTYHPSYYLRSPEQKAKGWQDLQRILRLLRG
jgi:DNA polymerase